LQLASEVAKGITGTASGLKNCSCVSLLLCIMTQPDNAVMLFGLSLMSSNAASIAASTLVTLRALHQTAKLMATTFGTLVSKPPSLTSNCLSKPDNMVNLLPACLQQIL